MSLCAKARDMDPAQDSMAHNITTIRKPMSNPLPNMAPLTSLLLVAHMSTGDVPTSVVVQAF